MLDVAELLRTQRVGGSIAVEVVLIEVLVVKTPAAPPADEELSEVLVAVVVEVLLLLLLLLVIHGTKLFPLAVLGIGLLELLLLFEVIASW